MQQQQFETEAERAGYTPEEYRELVRRAQEIRAEKEGRLSRDVLVESAAEVGIREEDLRAAEQQIRAERQQRQQQRTRIVTIAAVVVAVLLLFSIFTYNSLNASYEGVRNARADVQAVLQRRADLAQQLAPVVREGSAREERIMERIADAREQLQAGNLEAASEGLNQGLGGLVALAESNPQVSSSRLYENLQVQIEGSENRVAEYRRRYNRAATDYNRKARSFPTNLARPFFGFPSEVEPFEARGNVEAPPTY